MASGTQTDLPAAVYNAYSPVLLAVLALAGLVIATAGALAPAGWAARVPAALALRAE
jgi:putative ABC transport system permease protein